MRAIKRFLKVTFSLGLLALGGAAWYYYLHYSDPETVRHLVLEWAQEFCPKARFEITRAEANIFRGVSLRGCAIRTSDDPLDQLICFESMTVVPDRQRLLEGKLHIRQITLVGANLHLHQAEDGTWNFTQLLTGRKIRFPHPTDVIIKNGRIEFTFAAPDRPDTVLEDVDGTIELRPEGDLGVSLHAAHQTLKELSIKGNFDFVAQKGGVEAQTENPVELADLIDMAPEHVKESWADVDDIRGLVDLQLNGETERTENGFTWDGTVHGRLRRAMAHHLKLPYPLRDGEASFVARRDGLSITGGKFSLGPARGDVVVEIPEWKMERIEGNGTLRGVELTAAVRKLLPERVQATWDRFQPTGFVDVTGKVVRVGEELALVGYADVHEGTFRFEKFPYPVHSVTGRATLSDTGLVSLQFQGRGGNSELEMVGSIEPDPELSPFSITIRGEGAMLDEDLVQALPPGPAQVLRDLHPGTTTGDFICTVQREPGSHRVVHRTEVDIRSTDANWTGFPYPVRDVTGHLTIEPGRVEFHDFSASSVGGASVQLRGVVWTETEGTHTEVGVRGWRVPLDAKLANALPKHVQPLLDRLQAQGAIDLACNVVKGPNQDLWIEAEIDPASASIEPQSFPYRLEGFDGRVVYRNGTVEWKPMTAKHGPVLITCSGSFQGNENGGTLELRNLESASLVYDESLKRAAPPSLRQTLEFLHPTKPVGIRFPQVLVQWEKGTTSNWRIDLDGGISLKEADLIPEVGLKNVTGVVWYRGNCLNDLPKFTGNIELTSAVIEGFQAENVKSSFKVDGHRVDFPNLRGEMYDGQFHGSIRARTGEGAAYECRVNLYGAKLREYLAARSGKEAPSADGMVYLDLFLEGNAVGPGGIRGRGKLDVLEADIDNLPVLQDLFRIGNLQPPRGRAFEEVNCDFRVEDRIVRIEKLDLLGPANIVGPSFNLFSDGQGRLDVDTWEIDLALSARWGRGRLRVPVLTPSFNLASDQVFSYNLRGKLDQPIITPAPLNGFLRILEGNDPGEYARRRRFR